MRRRKGKNPRTRSKKVHSRKQNRTRKYKHSGWKLKQFPSIFKEVAYPPWIVRRDDKRFI